MIQMTFTKAFNTFFGKKEGQAMSDFANEIRATTATEADRAEWRKMFATVNIEIVEAK